MENKTNNFENAMAKLHSRIEKLGTQYARDIIATLQSHTRELNGALNDNPAAYEALLQKIVDDLNHMRNISIPLPVKMNGIMTTESLGAQFFIEKDRKTGKKVYQINIYKDSLKHYLESGQTQDCTAYQAANKTERSKILLINIISSLAHEYNHFIDMALPQHGALGTEIKPINGDKYDRSTYEKYMSHPTEIVSHKVEDLVKTAVAQHLKDFTPEPAKIHPLIQAYLNKPKRNI